MYKFQVRRLFCQSLDHLKEILLSGCVPSHEILYSPTDWEDGIDFVKGRGQWYDLVEGPDSTIFAFAMPLGEILYELVSYEVPTLDVEVLVTVEDDREIFEVGYFKGRSIALQYLEEHFGELEVINQDEFVWYGRAGGKVFCVAADIT